MRSLKAFNEIAMVNYAKTMSEFGGEPKMFASLVGLLSDRNGMTSSKGLNKVKLSDVCVGIRRCLANRPDPDRTQL